MIKVGQIAVLGGGPAGGSAALALARGGAAVTLYLPERPGEKPCGGAVPEHVLPRLAGFDPAALAAVASPDMLLEDGAGAHLDSALAGIRIFRRHDLDQAIVAAASVAGARIEPHRVEALAPYGGPRHGTDPCGVRVTAGGETRSYEWVIGADGARGLSRRTAGLRPQGESIGLGATLRGLTAGRLVLSFPFLADSYSWIFPRPGGASVGIAYSPEDLGDRAARAALDEMLDRHLPAGWRELPGSRYRYPIPVYGPWTVPGVRRALRQRLLLVGDAAALADPLTREGIRYGMLSGLWAAESLLAGDPWRYPARLAVELGEEMERADRARGLFFSGPVGRWMLPAARLHRGVRRVLADLLACRQSYLTLERRLLREALRP
jgi:geranylgeranyl diphosphate/geranylgeranyl-bacteriochlorophyllide a reductase